MAIAYAIFEGENSELNGVKSISLTEAEEEAVAREVHATHARIVHENLKLITDERVIEENPESHSGSMSSMKNFDDTYNFGDQFLYDKLTEDDQEKSKVIEESDSTIPDPSHQTVTSTPPVIAPFTDVSSTKPSSLVTPPPINTEATTIITSLPEITPFISLQLRVARLEQEMSEVKKTDHSADILEQHTADLIEKYSALPGPESIKNQESEKSPKEIIRIKREQGEEKQDSTYSIRSTDKVALEEFNLKSALFKHIGRKHSCYVRDTDGVELLKGSRGSNLYTISVEDMMKSSPICLLSKASKNKSWLWHRRLNHLNFGTINDLARKDLARGLPRLKFEKDHLCSACQLGKSKKHTHKPKTENTNLEVLNTLHMDLCGPMRVQTINGKKYILVIVDDYSRFTWVKFLRSKDETPAVVIKFLKQIQVGLNKTVRFIRTDNGTEFVNKTLYDHYEKVGIFHQKTVPRTPQQNGVVERRNQTLVEAARTMLIFSMAPMFLWAEAVATAFFGALCYPTNDSEDLGKLKPTADIGIFVGYTPNRKCYRIYNKRTRLIMETIHVTFDELTEQLAPVQFSSGPVPNLLTPGPISSGLYFNPPGIRQNPVPNVAQDPVIPTGPSVSIAIDLDAPSGSHTSSPLDHHSSSVHHGLAGEPSASLKGFHHSVDKESLLEIVFGDSFSSNFSHKSQLRDMPFGATLTQNENPTHYVWKRLMVEIYYLNDSLWCQNNFVQDPCAQCMAPDQSSQTRAS
ncbi:retrovirus-related pol polyprotein from transposon TNT 1-94 [Tanacetum coccineum]